MNDISVVCPVKDCKMGAHGYAKEAYVAETTDLYLDELLAEHALGEHDNYNKSWGKL